MSGPLIVSSATYPNARYTPEHTWNRPKFIGAPFTLIGVSTTDAVFELPPFDDETLHRVKAFRLLATAILTGPGNARVFYQRRAIWNGADVFEAYGADRYSKFDGAGRLLVEYEFEIDKPTELDGPWSGPAIQLTLYWTPLGIPSVPGFAIDPRSPTIELLGYRTSGRRRTTP